MSSRLDVERDEVQAPCQIADLPADILASTDDAILSYNLEGTIYSWNSGAERLYGYTAVEAVGKQIWMLVSPVRRIEQQKVIDRLRSGERVESYETAHLRKSGERVLVSVGSALIRRPDSSVCGVLSIVRNQTAHIKAERAISGELSREVSLRAAAEAAEAKSKELLELAPDGVVIIGRDGLIALVNSQTEGMFGYDRNELLGQPVEKLLPERFGDLHVDHRAQYMAGPRMRPMGAGLDLFGKRKDGSEFPVEIALSPMGSGQDLTVTAIIRDITERKLAEQVLEQSEARFRLLVENAKDYAIFSLDPEGRISSWNAGAERMKGYQPEEVVGRHLSIFYRPDDIKAGRPQASLDAAAREGQHEEQAWRVRKDGSEFLADVVTAALRDESGGLIGYSKIVRDVTERIRAEERIKQLNDDLQRRAVELEAANKELEAFSYSVSHDLRSPLRSINGFSQALMEDYADKLDSDARNLLQRVQAASQRMGQLIDDLLMLSRLTRSEMRREPVDLSSLAEEIMADLRKNAPDRQAKLRIESGMVTEGDAHLIRIALENLLGNAWKFTSKRRDAKIDFASSRRNHEKVFYISDNGAGFDMAYADTMFAPFQRLHRADEFSGTGIGLAMVQRIMRRHGGQIWAEGVVGQGATFYFTIPMEMTPDREPTAV